MYTDCDRNMRVFAVMVNKSSLQVGNLRGPGSTMTDTPNMAVVSDIEFVYSFRHSLFGYS